MAYMQAPTAYKKRVRWADEIEDEEEEIGFSIGGASRQQVLPPNHLCYMKDGVQSSQ